MANQVKFTPMEISSPIRITDKSGIWINNLQGQGKTKKERFSALNAENRNWKELINSPLLTDTKKIKLLGNVAKQCTNYKEIKEVFDTSLEKKLPNSRVFARYIIKCNFPKAEESFKMASQMGFANSKVRSFFIESCKINGELEKGKKVFNETNWSSISHKMIFHYFKLLKEYCDTTEAGKAFELAKNLKLLNCYNSCEYIKILVKNKELVKGEEILDLCIELDIADQFHFLVCMNAYATDFKKAKEIYEAAYQKGHGSILLDSYFIKICGKNKKFDIAEEIYKKVLECKDRDNIRPFFLSYFIHCCGDCNKIREINTCLETAKKLGCLNGIVIAHAISAYYKNNLFAEGRELFKSAIQDGYRDTKLFHKYFRLFNKKNFIESIVL